jgi:hypothetical protein
MVHRFVTFHACHGKESRQHRMIVEVASNDLLQRFSLLGSALRPQNGIVFVTMAQPARHFEECSEAAKLDISLITPLPRFGNAPMSLAQGAAHRGQDSQSFLHIGNANPARFQTPGNYP